MKWMLSTCTDYHNRQNMTVSLLTYKAKAHSFYSDMAADEGGEKKGFKVSSGQFASLTVCHSFGNSMSTKHAVSAAEHTTESFFKIPSMIQDSAFNLQSRFLMWMEQGYFGKECTHECKFHKPYDLSVPNTNSLFFYGIKITCVCVPMHSA